MYERSDLAHSLQGLEGKRMSYKELLSIKGRGSGYAFEHELKVREIVETKVWDVLVGKFAQSGGDAVIISLKTLFKRATSMFYLSKVRVRVRVSKFVLAVIIIIIN